MKIINRGIISAAALAASALTASAAQASDGTITFTGQVTGQTCTINGGNSNFTVVLPTVQTTALPSFGSSAGRTNFTIELSNCTPTSGSVVTFFESGPTVSLVTNNLKNQAPGGAANVEVQLVDVDTDTLIALAAPPGGQFTSPVGINPDGTTRMHYAAQYFAVGTVTPGAVDTTVVYSLHYN